MVVTRGVQLPTCIFCASDDVSQEHLVADWALRGYARKRKPPMSTAYFVGQRIVAISDEDPILTAGVTCQACNTGWIKAIDDAASAVLKPLIRGERTIELDKGDQAVVAAWVFKTALICDAAQNHLGGDLAPLRAQFARERGAPPGCVIYVGPAAPAIAGRHRAFGVRRLNGKVRLAVVSADETERRTGKPIAIPGYLVMLGALDAILGGRLSPVTADSLHGFAQVWPRARRACRWTRTPAHAPLRASQSLRRTGRPRGPCCEGFGHWRARTRSP